MKYIPKRGQMFHREWEWPDWENASWKDIQTLARTGQAKDLISLGATKTVTLSSPVWGGNQHGYDGNRH